MTSQYSYQRLEAHNASRLLGAKVFDNPVDPDQLDRFVQDPGHELVFALDGERVVGFASGTVLLHPDKRPMFFLNEVDVADAYQRRGIATELCQRLINTAREIGCVGVWLATEADNMPARGLYHVLNARETEGIVVYDWDGVMDA